MRTVVLSRFSFVTVGLVGLLMVAGGAYGQNTSDPNLASGLRVPTSGTEHIRVVSHLPLNNIHVNQMFVQQRGSRVYLFLHRPVKQAYALVDVTSPDNPALVERAVLQESASGQVEGAAGGSVLAIAVTPETTPDVQTDAAPRLPSETVQFVDMSNPKSPKSVQTFKGVTSIYSDDARKLVYLVNADGLWIVSHHMTHPLPLCNSESALTPEPDCQ
jgi:hypothetical protein